MKIEEISIEHIKTNPQNAKMHSAEQIDKISDSIKEFGFNNPILVDEKKVIIAGHGRHLAAIQSGMEKVPCVVLGHLTDEQKRAYVIADNKLGEIGGGWHEELLKIELKALRDLDDFDEFLTGFNEVEIDDLLEAEKTVSEAEEIIHEQSLQVSPAKEYVLIMAEDLSSWDEMKAMLDLKIVRRGGYKQGSPFDATGTQRVINWKDFKKTILNA